MGPPLPNSRMPRFPLALTCGPSPLVRGETPGSPTSPLLAGGVVVPMWAEPAEGLLVQPFSLSVSLPAGKAGLRRRIVVALNRV
jgi:hypothetical protein